MFEELERRLAEQSENRQRWDRTGDKRVCDPPRARVSREDVPAQENHRQDRREDRVLRFGEDRDGREDRGDLGPAGSQAHDREEYDEGADRVDLSPHGTVEPRDRVEEIERRGHEARTIAGLAADDEPGDERHKHIGQDRRNLDEEASSELVTGR